MRIVVDMQGAQTESRFRGIGRYTLSFTRALARNRGEHEIILALSGLFPETIQSIRDAFHDLLPQENIRVWFAPGSTQERDENNRTRRDVAELAREAFLAGLEPDVIHLCSLFEGFVDDAVTSIGRLDTCTPVTVTLHDLIPLINPGQYLRPNPDVRRYYERKIDHLGRAAACLAISAFSRQEGLEHLNFDESAIVNISTAIEADFRPQHIAPSEAEALRQKFGLTRSFLLYAGGADERKNLPRLIQAFAALPTHLRTHYQLLFAGKITPVGLEDLRHHARQAGLKDGELLFTGYVSDTELLQLYTLCHLFVFPSWHEGFGLPALEAMACGAAVIASNTSSLPEIIGRADALFDPLDVHSITAKIVEVLESENFRQELRAYGLNQAKRFSWDTTALLALQVFEQLHAAAGQTPLPRLDSQQTEARLIETLGSGNILPDFSEQDLVRLSTAIAQNHPPVGRRPQLLVDISKLAEHDVKTGIQRVVRSILSELLTNPPEDYEVRAVYSSTGCGYYRYADAFVRRLNNAKGGEEEDGIVDPQNGDIFLGLDLQSHLHELQGYYRHLRNIGVRVYFVVYDLLPMLMPHAFSDGYGEWFERWWLGVIIENDGAICISRAVADELRAWMASRRSPDSLSFLLGWFHLGADIENSIPTRGLPEDAGDVLARIEARPSFLMVGTLEPRKGHRQVLAAMEKLWSEGCDVGLVIVGKRGWKVDDLAAELNAHPEHGKRLFWLANTTDEYLERIYAASACLLMASEGEGFGLPLIEAARHSCPIIARDIPVFREVAGTHAYYFSGVSADDLATALQDWLELRAAGNAPLSTGFPFLSWKQSAAQLLQAILPKRNRPCLDTEEQMTAERQTDNFKPRVLQLIPYPIRKPRHGGQLRASAIRRSLLENGFDVQSIGFYQEEGYRKDALSPHDVAFPPQSPFRLYRGNHIPELTDFAMTFFAVNDEQAYRQVKQAVRATIDVIIVEQPWFYPLAKRLQAEVPACRDTIIVFSSQNIEAPMKRGMFENLNSITTEAIEDIASLEREAAREADFSVAVTEEDANVFREYGSKTVIVAPNGIDPWSADSERLDFWRPRLPQNPWPLFVASAHPPNFIGFMASVGNALGCIPPGSRLVIAGGAGPHLERMLFDSPWGRLNASRIQVLGVLDDDDLAAVKQLAHVFLLPIGGGGGSNIKTAEALYSGKPVICTSTALRGFEDYRGLPGLSVADTPQAFQQAIRSTLQSNRHINAGLETDRRLRQRLTWRVSLNALPHMVSNVLFAKWKTS
ncbi:MAG: glycosyltransferase [Betaproteobacteria bacterium]|nr:glycosyltransferase [Betaproteobacteria bacterium]